MKRDDSYHFSIPFEYIVGHDEDGEAQVDTAYMEVDLNWNDASEGYDVSYYCPDMASIDPAEGNGDEESFFEYDVELKLMEELDALGIGVLDVCI